VEESSANTHFLCSVNLRSRLHYLPPVQEILDWIAHFAFQVTVFTGLRVGRSISSYSEYDSPYVVSPLDRARLYGTVVELGSQEAMKPDLLNVSH
jgi:hypothetical protein